MEHPPHTPTPARSRRDFLGGATIAATAFAITPCSTLADPPAPCAPPILSQSSAPFSFAVLGDLHLSRPNYETRAIAAAIAKAIENVQPPVRFICQTGDLAHGEQPSGHRQLAPDEMKEELQTATAIVAAEFRRPVFVAVGNHDKHAGGTPYAEAVLPFLSKQLGTPLTRSFYAFQYGNSCLVFLDFGDYSDQATRADYTTQALFLEKTLERARVAGLGHVFLFAHYPLWPVARAGFSNRRFTDSLLPTLKRHPIDAFFCGHTHNTGAWVRRVDGTPITQIQGVASGQSATLQRMDQRRTSLIPKTDLSYGWGYLSGPPNGFYLVTVDGPQVRVQLRSGNTILREFQWREPGTITDTIQPPHDTPTPISEGDLDNLESAKLIFTAWTAEGADVSLVLNGVRIGQAHMEPMPHYAAFTGEIAVSIPPGTLRDLRPDNSLILENPRDALVGIGNARLEARSRDGRVIRSGVSDRYYLSATRAQVGPGTRSAYGWEILPAEITTSVPLGQPLGPIRLNFPRADAAPARDPRAPDSHPPETPPLLPDA